MFFIVAGRTERVIVDDVSDGSQLMLLPGIDAQYRLLVAVIGKEGEETAQGAIIPSADDIVSEEKVFRTLPYVNCKCEIRIKHLTKLKAHFFPKKRFCPRSQIWPA